MKGLLLILLIIIVAAGWIGTLAAKDPGFVLISYDGSTLQTGLWVFLGALVVLLTGIYFLQRLVFSLVNGNRRFRSWRSERVREKSTQHTQRGLVYLQEGNPDRAEKFLLSGARKMAQPAFSFISLARAADARGEAEQREAYLRQAVEAESGSVKAVAVAAAEMARDRGDWQQVLDRLRDVADNPATLRMKKLALISLEDWEGLAPLLPKLKPLVAADELADIHKQILLHRMHSGDQPAVYYRKASEELRADPDVVTALARVVVNEAELEPLLRNTLKKSWRPELVELYGGLGSETLDKRIKVAEGWLKQHPDDVSLASCLGVMSEAAGKKDDARRHYERCIELSEGMVNRTASRNLANMLAFDGDYQKSNEYLRLALAEPGPPLLEVEGVG